LETTPCKDVAQARDSITVIDLSPFKELFEANRNTTEQPSGLTAIELGEALGIGKNKTHILLSQAHKAGKLKSSVRIDNNHWSGRTVRNTVYEWIN